MVQATVAVALFVLALLAPEVAAQLGVVSNPVDATRLEPYHMVAFGFKWNRNRG